MFQKKSHSWTKNLDILIVTLVALHCSLALSYFIHIEHEIIYSNSKYLNISCLLSLVWFLLFVSLGLYKSYKSRSFFNNLLANINQLILADIATVIYIFATKQGIEYSRMVIFVYFPILYILISEILLFIYKKIYFTFNDKSKIKKSLLIITNSEFFDLSDPKTILNGLSDYSVIGFMLTNDKTSDFNHNKEIIVNKFNEGTPNKIDVITEDDYLTFANKQWIDEILVVTDTISDKLSKILEDLTYCGSTVHVSLTNSFYQTNFKQFSSNVGPYKTITTTLNYMSTSQMFIKRLVDIFGALVGCFITGLMFLFLAPIMLVVSPGPIFFKQKRVGLHGKVFNLYKFRTMYVDAESRKKELEKQNLFGDGMMFKMEFDPRIIGNKILPDGTHKEGIGAWIRKLSIDEFPQFFNVLKGDMSLVGTRPPTLDEWNKYCLFHKSRLFIKPGITGLWQVSGRSTITSFEDVVALDRKYIKEWSLINDIKIILKTIKVVILHKDAY